MTDVFAGLLHPPVVRPGDVIPDPAAVERGRRGAAAKHARKAAGSTERRWPPHQNPWGLCGAEWACLKALIETDEDQGVVASALCISPKTLSTYTQRLRDKMGVKTTTHAILKFDRWMRGSVPEDVEVVLRYVQGEATVQLRKPQEAMA